MDPVLTVHGQVPRRHRRQRPPPILHESDATVRRKQLHTNRTRQGIDPVQRNNPETSYKSDRRMLHHWQLKTSEKNENENLNNLCLVEGRINLCFHKIDYQVNTCVGVGLKYVGNMHNT